MGILFLSKSGFVKVSIGEILLEDKNEERLFFNVIMYIVKKNLEIEEDKENKEKEKRIM